VKVKIKKSFGILAAAMLSTSMGSTTSDIEFNSSQKRVYNSSSKTKPLNQRKKRRDKRRVCKY